MPDKVKEIFREVMTVEKQQQYSGIRKPKKSTQQICSNQTGSTNEEEDEGIMSGLSLKQQDGDVQDTHSEG